MTTPTPSLADRIEEGAVVHFITADPNGPGNITACGVDYAYQTRGNGWRVWDISCRDCNRVICSMAHAALRAQQEQTP